MIPFFSSIARLNPGQSIPTAEQWNSLVSAVEALSKIDVIGANSIQRVGNQLSLDLSQKEVWNARITGTDGALYSWQEVFWNNGAWFNGPRVGVAGAGASLPARELSGSTAVKTDGSVVARMWYADDATATEFSYCCTGGGVGQCVNVVTGVCLDGSGNIIVEKRMVCLPSGSTVGTSVCVTNPNCSDLCPSTVMVPCCPDGPAVAIPTTLHLTITAIQDPGLSCLSVGEVIPIKYHTSGSPWQWWVTKRLGVYSYNGPIDVSDCLNLNVGLCFPDTIGNGVWSLSTVHGSLGINRYLAGDQTLLVGTWPTGGTPPAACLPLNLTGQLQGARAVGGDIYNGPAFTAVLTT